MGTEAKRAGFPGGGLLLAALMAGAVLPARADGVTATVAVDASASQRHAINPLIYGIGVGDATSVSAADLKALNFTVSRIGGNGLSTYNWKQNAHNLGSDWYFESYPFASKVPGAEIDAFVAANTRAKMASMVTVPMMKWMAKLGSGRSVLSSFSIAKYGAQTDHDYWYPDAGNGVLAAGGDVTGNDPRDAYTPSSPAVQKGFVAHLVGKSGGAAGKGPAYYLLDNEVSLWSSTHRDIHPGGVHATEARDAMVKYAAAIRAADPAARIVGPEEWGWLPFLYSGYDQAWAGANGWSTEPPDHKGPQAGTDYMAWLLDQMKAAGRPIDVFSMHYYPQSGEFSDDTSDTVQALRNRSTRELWDPDYRSESWIGEKVQLIPRMKALVEDHYHAGTPTALTEYSWGGDASIGGATAQADLLGIFGREGLDIATRWGVPAAWTPTFKAMQIFRNYDGNRHVFGETGVAATVADPDELAAFAALRAEDGALTTVIVNKSLPGSDGAASATRVSLKGFAAARQALAYQLTGDNVIARLADPVPAGGAVTLPTPAQSVTMLVVAAKGRTIAAPPFARFTASPSVLSAGQPVSARLAVDASASTAGSSAIAGYAWSFGDGGSGRGVTAAHRFRRYGIFPVTLTVTDAAGLVDRRTLVVPVRPKPSTARDCSVTYAKTSDWGTGFTANLHVVNTGSADLTDWALAFSFPGDQHISNLWNGSLQVLGTEQFVVPVDWTRTIAAGGAIDIGFYASYSGANDPPAEIRLNGMSCLLD